MMNSIRLVLIGLAVMAGLVFILLRNSDEIKTQANTFDALPEINLDPELDNPLNPGDLSEIQEAPPGYIQYQNEKYGFSFYHSPQAKITEYDEGGGAMTVVLENVEKVRGMQVFIVPYKEKLITEERFKKDVPSGVRENVAKTYIGKKKIEAVTFNSYDLFLGETREVWFIYNGYLFEITTFKGVADWFVPKMQTWRFI